MPLFALTHRGLPYNSITVEVITYDMRHNGRATSKWDLCPAQVVYLRFYPKCLWGLGISYLTVSLPYKHKYTYEKEGPKSLVKATGNPNIWYMS